MHSYDCENCINLKYLIDKGAEKESEKVVEKHELLAKMAKEILELKNENAQLKEDNNILEQKIKGLEVEDKNQVVEICKIKKETTDLKDQIKTFKHEVLHLKSNASKTENELLVAEKALEKINDMEKLSKNVVEENKKLKANREKYQRLDDVKFKDLIEKVKQKDNEIENLYLIIKNNTLKGTEMLKVNEKLEKEVEELKEISKNPIKECEYNYQCDECLKRFKTAGLLRRHNKNDHEIFA